MKKLKYQLDLLYFLFILNKIKFKILAILIAPLLIFIFYSSYITKEPILLKSYKIILKELSSIDMDHFNKINYILLKEKNIGQRINLGDFINEVKNNNTLDYNLLTSKYFTRIVKEVLDSVLIRQDIIKKIIKNNKVDEKILKTFSEGIMSLKISINKYINDNEREIIEIEIKFKNQKKETKKIFNLLVKNFTNELSAVTKDIIKKRMIDTTSIKIDNTDKNIEFLRDQIEKNRGKINNESLFKLEILYAIENINKINIQNIEKKIIYEFFPKFDSSSIIAEQIISTNFELRNLKSLITILIISIIASLLYFMLFFAENYQQKNRKN